MNGTATVTVLTCDIVESTAMMARLGDDDADALRRELFAGWRVAVEHEGGTVVKTIGDAIMAVFRSSAVPAAAAAIGLLEVAERASRVEPVHLRVGIATGEAAEEDGDWFGTPVVEAFRLCAQCSTDEILVSGTARRVIGSRGGYTFAAVGDLTLKGLPDPVPAFALVHARAPEPTVRTSDPATGTKRSRRLLAVGLGAAVVIAVAVAIIASGGDSSNPDDAATEWKVGDLGYTPELTKRACTEAESGGDGTARCFTLSVPLDRSRPRSRKVRLPVLRVPSTQPRAPAAIAFARLTGSPIATSDRSFADQWSVGVRGEPGSEPALACPEADRDRRARLAVDAAAARTRLHDQLDGCMAGLAADGIDLTSFGPDEVADDARDLIIAADLGRVDLRSYGSASLPAFSLLRRSPGLVRALMLTSPQLPGTDSVQRAQDAELAVDALIERCGEDPVCRATAPDLGADLDALRTAVAGTPQRVETIGPDGQPATVLVDSDRVQTAMWQAVHDDQVYGLVPSVVRTRSLDLVASYLALTHLGEAPAEPTIRSVLWECELSGGADAVAVTPVRRQYPQWSTLAIPEIVDLCRRYDIRENPALSTPVVSDQPALVTYGELEPEAPRIARLADTLAAAQLLPLEGRVRGDRRAWPACVVDVRRVFALDPRSPAGTAACGARAERLTFAATPPTSFG